MQKRIFVGVLFSLIILFSFVSADINVETRDKGSVVIAELDNPAVFDFIINNPGPADNIEIFSFVGVTFSPRGGFDLPSGTSTIEVKAYPNKEVRNIRGLYTFEYQMIDHQLL